MLVGLIYPHQLYQEHPAGVGADACVLVEDPLFFRQNDFHVQKLVMHRASMKRFERVLAKRIARPVHYVDAAELTSSGDIVGQLLQLGATAVQFVDPCDDWLSRRLTAALHRAKLPYQILEDPHSLHSQPAFESLAERKPKLFFTEFYIQQRKRLGVLLDDDGKAVGGKWSYDTENRKKLPAGLRAPLPVTHRQPLELQQAQAYVGRHFPHAWGDAKHFRYPLDRSAAKAELELFIEQRLPQFGMYEDAIDREQTFVFHSVLTPALNIGLISPQEIVQAALSRADEVPLSSLEGFIRQVIGWREYIKCVYLRLGSKQRTSNYWQHHRSMPQAFYTGTTGIEPVDVAISRLHQFSYCHHIERLMVLGNFMLLCEIHPDAIYRWFMELFIDAYDWVMVPNVYGMSQHADGGLITTKPYISGSNYIRKMSNYKAGPWCAVWDALYWRFVDRQRDFFLQNPRTSVMVRQLERMGPKLAQHHQIAEKFLNDLR